MKYRLTFTFPVLIFSGLLCWFSSSLRENTEISELRQRHSVFLKERAPKNSDLSRVERLRKGIPPNDYYELMEYLTMNPALGYPEPYKLRELQKELSQKRSKNNRLKAPGDTQENLWYSRGPINVGGRTRVLLFDPNDPDGERVFAGAISGGLWINEDITNVNSLWHQVKGLPSNLNISCITVDPRDNQTWYVGTGEQYTGGDVVGTGVYKTTDGGKSWEQILDVTQFDQSSSGSNLTVEGGVYFINDIQAWDNGTFTEVFIGVATHIYANARNPYNFMGFYDRGLYGSKDGGSTWVHLVKDESFNDFEIDASGNIWAATTESPGQEGSYGGKIFKRDKGEQTDFSLVQTIPNVLRTEIEASATNPDKFYILAEYLDPTTDAEEAEIWRTIDGFATLQPLAEPQDADPDIPADDFARGQAFYNLLIETDPTDDNIVYVGGIDLFKSSDGGLSWKQISKWHSDSYFEDLPFSEVHADHHVMQFRPGNTNQAIFGHDGGVSFATDLSNAHMSDVFITPEANYITTQFYSVAVAPNSFASGDYFLGGTQDNGTQLMQNGARESLGILGGDGAHSFYDQVDTDYLIANITYNNMIIAYDYSQKGIALIANNDDRDGFFINPQALDSNLEKLFSNGPEGTLYRYDNLSDLETIGDDGLQDSDPVAPRVSLRHSLLHTSISAINVSPFTTTSSTLLLGLIDGTLIKVEDADGPSSLATWSEITGPDFLGSISDVEFGRSEAEIFVTFYNYGVKSIWYTDNGLDENPTWKNKEGNLPDLPVLSILQNPLNPDEVIVGTELGVWSSDDFLEIQPTWKQAYNGMSDVKVTDLDLKKGANTVFAASYGRGIFSGKFQESSEIPDLPNPDLDVVVYPTVSDGRFQVVSNAKSGMAEILIYNLQGKLVKMTNVQLDQSIPAQLHLLEEASGIYFLHIVHGENRYIRKVIRK